MKIIIIDDDPLVALSLKTILETDTDIEVAAIGNDGKKALTLYEKHQPDILLMDIRMNRVTGLEAGEQLLCRYPDCKNIIM